MLDDLEGLRALVAVADLGSFSAAGRALRLSTNAISHRVARLEERVGARLFERTTRHVRSTEAGERLLVRARRIIEELELAEREVATSSLAGSVRVAIPPDLGGPTLMTGLAQLLAASPGLRLELLGRPAPVDPRREGLDIVVWGGSNVKIPPDLSARRVGALSWSLCAAPAYVALHGAPLVPEELSLHRCLLARNPDPERTWPLVGPGGREASPAVTGNFESDHPQLLLEALLQGLGIGIRPSREVQRAAGRGEWIHVLPEWGFRPLPVSLVSPRGRLRVPSVRRVADVIEATLRQLVAPASSSRAS